MQTRSFQNAFFIALVVLTTLAFLGLILDFMMPLFWAAVLAILFQPVQRYWLRTVGGRTVLASILTLVTILLCVILPLFLVGLAVSREAISLYERIAAGEIDLQEPIRAIEQALPLVSEYLERFDVDLAGIQENLSSAAVAASQFVATRILAIGQNALEFTVLFFLMLYVLFFSCATATRS